LTVAAYAALSLLYVGVAEAVSTGRGAGIAALFLLLLAATVLWRRRWAWLLMLLWAAGIVLAPAWGDGLGGIAYAVNVLSVGLLLSPGMLRWVGVAGRSRRAQPST
jgi:hypothetical protein